MIGNHRILALVPARGGSKGLPGKNIRPLAGKPLIGWSIEQARGCRYFDRVAVSTDSSEIAEVGRAFGAEVPFLRPPELASDKASSIDVILHALDFYAANGEAFDWLALIEPTSPLRETKDLDAAVEQLHATPEAESIVGVCRVENAHPAFLTRMEGAFLRPFVSGGSAHARRQDIEPLYFFEGSLYIAQVDSLRSRRAFYHEKTLGFAMAKWKSFEVDDLVDFLIIERLLQAKLAGEIA